MLKPAPAVALKGRNAIVLAAVRDEFRGAAIFG